jgi:hypothetical protein
MYLSQLSPAEILILTHKKTTLKELLKITLLDLILKKVLKIIEVTRNPSVVEGTLVYSYITRGPNFKNHTFKKQEEFFTSTFAEEEEYQVLFRNMVKIGYQKSKKKSHFIKQLFEKSLLQRCFSQNLFQEIFNLYSLTAYGEEIKRKVEKEISDLDQQFCNKSEINHHKTIELISTIGANLFLLKNIDYDLLNQIDSDLITEMKRKENNQDHSIGCSGCSWGSFDGYSTSFDSGCSSDSTSVSGCGGDSGCSGCGGCGGCGGCS